MYLHGTKCDLLIFIIYKQINTFLTKNILKKLISNSRLKKIDLFFHKIFFKSSKLFFSLSIGF